MFTGVGKRQGNWLLICSSLLLLLACSETSTSASLSANQVPVLTSTALRPKVEQAQLDVYLNAIAAEEQQRQAEATLTVVYAAQTATEVALQRTATAESRRATTTAQAGQATATARAWEVTATAAAAQATATAQTASGQAQATTTAQAATAQAAQAAATATAQLQLTRAAERAALAQEELQRAQLETQRQRLLYPLRAYGPWSVLLVLLALVVWGGARFVRAYEMRLRAVQRDARGDAPLMVFQQGGRIVAYDPDRACGPATIFDAEVTQPQLADAAAQERTTARDQTIDLTSRGLPRGTRSARQPTQAQARKLLQRANRSSQLDAGEVQIVPPARVRPWLREVRPQALQQALTIEGEVLDGTQS